MKWKNQGSSWAEEIEIAVEGLAERVKELIQEGNVRRLIIRKMNGDLLLEIPLTAGVAVGAVLTYLLPLLVGLVAVTGLLTRVKIQVIRDDG
ncbi:Domain of unknown function DUF4342 [Syntrophomonas zehnderi OL-4]|uniref:DUF4342 domain-containing protein n=1 Tax=Syntrophomonas zehnderi OL-4 TaxID=690567 RepID=A0A0E4C845_9FIRM|nr:DUF4342 domain-containing protein [Syntrophomonas zehnderi]CFX27386.1 Domain of unknown function DUF4342 [Syntrophomonas zehnderi OL-4]